ncbi:restriction endonuclease subunit S [Pleomorphovibrio marinus]|uniref:restriction endonuclease subunit S n=1 Tax=Pleomorphovibrio marinus TaxID=2164132 RepID=UPI000E0C23A6|nr:restriction endonuclease subunit S [Pleomorphovibrio marinus]
MSELKETEFGAIPKNWNFTIATDYCLKITDGTHDSPKRKAEGKFLVTSKHIKGRNIDFENAYLIDESDFIKINERSQVEQWDVIISMIGEYCGFTYVERNSEIDYAVKNVGLFKAGSKVKALWLHYFLNSPMGKMILDVNKSGSSQPYISLGALRNLPILDPSEDEKKSILAILSSLDDKIDLLHRQNQTLEQMAETLFRQWFVEESDEGWENKKLKELVNIGIGRTPPRKEFHWFSKLITDVKWVSIKDLGDSGLFVLDTSEYLTEEAVEKFNIPIIPPDTVLLSFKMTLGRVAITTEHMLSNEAIAHFKFNEKTPFSKEFLYFYLKTYPYETLGSTSSIVTSINSGMIKDMEAIIPDDETLSKFENYVIDYFDKIKSNQTQIRTLTALRDTLLPKLMSGEVRIV